MDLRDRLKLKIEDNGLFLNIDFDFLCDYYQNRDSYSKTPLCRVDELKHLVCNYTNDLISDDSCFFDDRYISSAIDKMPIIIDGVRTILFLYICLEIQKGSKFVTIKEICLKNGYETISYNELVDVYSQSKRSFDVRFSGFSKPINPRLSDDERYLYLK